VQNADNFLRHILQYVYNDARNTFWQKKTPIPGGKIKETAVEGRKTNASQAHAWRQARAGR
jgi:hypothetical protein